MNRLLLFVHYHKYGGLAEHVLYTLRAMRPLFARVVFVSNSPLTEAAVNKLSPFCDKIMGRVNRGFDFGAWRDGLGTENAGGGGVGNYDSVTLMNDLCVGPLCDIGAIYQQYEARAVDFWGLTGTSGAARGMPGAPELPIPAHLQSYFLCFNRRVVASAAWQNFWARVADENTVEEVIQKYETQLTGILFAAGFTGAAMVQIAENDYRESTAQLLENNVPFLRLSQPKEKTNTKQNHGYRPYLQNIDQSKRILEIGPLHQPLFTKATANVFYADIRSTKEVKELYRNDPNVDQSRIVDIDFVIKDSYKATFTGKKKFDYFVASHVLEHIPQLILFFQDIAEILNPGAKICLSVPDHRYCFDHYRAPTSFAETYDIYVRGITNNPMRVLDNSALSTINDPGYWWHRRNDYEKFPQDDSRYYWALDRYHRASRGEYLNAHFSVFTPESFLRLLYQMTAVSLLPFQLAEFYDTDIGAIEFNAVLALNKNLSEKESADKKAAEKILLSYLNEIGGAE